VTGERLTRHFVLLRALRWLPVGVVLPFLVITPEARGLSIGEVGAVLAIHSAVAIVLEVPSGVLADALGRRRVMLVGALATAASLALFAVAQSVPTFMVSLGLLAAGRALISGALEAWYVDALRLLDPVAPLASGLSKGTAAEGLAMALGALIGGAAVAISGQYGAAAGIAAVAAVVYLVAVAALVHEPARDHPGAALRGTLGRRTREVLGVARAELVASRAVQIVFVTGAALGVVLSAVELLWQPRLAELLGNETSGGFVFGALTAGSMIAVAIGASLSPRAQRGIGLRTAYPATLVLTALVVVLLGAPETAVAFAIVYLLVYAGLGVCEPLHVQLLNDAVGSSARATLISAEALASQSGSLVTNLAAGALAAAHGAEAVWTITGTLLALTGAAIALPLRRSGQRMISHQA
jgi:MFS family permease